MKKTQTDTISGSTSTRLSAFIKRWKANNLYRESIKICLPLVLSMSTTTIMEFTDRIFLSNYDIKAVAAAMPAGIAAFLFMAFLGGIGGYSAVFIAQYTGRGENNKVGVVFWQGVYFCLFSSLFFILLAYTTGSVLFELVGHPTEIREMESQYFTILCYGGVFHVTLNTFSTFFSGRGLTPVVMVVYFIAMLINIPLNYALIYGAWGFPELGISGAGIATVSSWFIPTVLLLFMVFSPENRRKFDLISNRGFNKEVFLRILKYGVPGSLQFTIDILAFTIFIFLIGKIGTTALAISTIVISINSVAFMPSMGVSQGISIMVGQALGKGKIDQAKMAFWSSTHLLLIYVFIIDLLFLTMPKPILSLFLQHGSAVEEARYLLDTGSDLLFIVSCYLFLDSLYMVFTGVLKGAGDNTFLMWSIAALSLTCLIIPCFVGIIYFSQGLYYCWFCILLFIASLCLASAFRYYQGYWKNMLVIEQPEKK